MEIRSEKTKQEFIAYLNDHPDERFWQAVRNFAGIPFVFASARSATDPLYYQDTFYWEGRNS